MITTTSDTDTVFSIKLHNLLNNLVERYFPFNLLSPKRVREIVNLVRFVEMKDGEIFQLRGGRSRDYLFLVEGSAELVYSGNISSIGNAPLQSDMKPIMLPSAPETATLVARENTIFCHANREMLDYLLAWDSVVRIANTLSATAHERLNLVRNALVFQRLPLDCLIPAFAEMTEQTLQRGDSVVEHTQEAQPYYLVLDGQAEVSRQLFNHDNDLTPVATLNAGDAFGEEAVIGQASHRETVTITSDQAKILTLPRHAWHNLVNHRDIRTVNAHVAHTMMENGFVFLDVRFADEYAQGHIPDSISLPLHDLEQSAARLDNSRRYIAYCSSGSRGAVAAAVLSKQGYDVLNMRSGLRDWPFEVTTPAGDDTDQTQ